MATSTERTDYSEEMAEALCDHVAGGGTIREFCDIEGSPAKSSVFSWLRKNPDFAAAYSAARVIQADALADEMKEIADGDGDPPKVRNQLSTRQWLAARAAPKVYGDKVGLEHSGEVGFSVEIIRFSDLPPEPA